MADPKRWMDGPWRALDVWHKASIEIRHVAGYWPIARVKKGQGNGPDQITEEQARFHASLLALAPEMRQALSRALPYVEWAANPDNPEQDRAAAAVASDIRRILADADAGITEDVSRP